MRCFCWLLLSLTVAGCAPIHADNRYGLAHLDEYLVPESESARWALAPVAVPVGLATYLVDGLVIHPFMVWDDAWTDTRDLLWDTRDDSPFRRSVSFPFRVVGTPVIWVLDFVARWLLPLEHVPLSDQPWDEPPGGAE
jgi:hypothetical protein